MYKDLKECPLVQKWFGYWLEMLSETALYSVVTCIENAAEPKIQLEAFLQLSEHVEFKPCRWIGSILENRIRGASPVGDIQRISMSEGCHSGSCII